jgi:hypothetical protein
MTKAMSILATLRDAVIGQAMRVATDPRLTKVASSPRVMNAAMRALSLGGAVKNEVSKVTRVAAGVFGIATEEEVASLRSTIQTLEDTVATLEAEAQAAARRAGPTP